jgi:hypothetical protein
VVSGRPCSRRSQVLGILNKELDEDTQIAKQQKVLLKVKAQVGWSELSEVDQEP